MKEYMKEGSFKEIAKKIVHQIERAIIVTLIVLMALILIAATVELAYQTIVALLFGPEVFLIDSKSLMELFGIFLLVLIGVELLDTIKVYFKKNVVHVEVIILVAVIAIARKVIVLDFSHYSGLEIIGIGFIIIALTAGYYLIKKAGGCQFYISERDSSGSDETIFVSDDKICSCKSRKNVGPETGDEEGLPGRKISVDSPCGK